MTIVPINPATPPSGLPPADGYEIRDEKGLLVKISRPNPQTQLYWRLGIRKEGSYTPGVDRGEVMLNRTELTELRNAIDALLEQETR